MAEARISTFFQAFVWGWVILASWIGWGRLLALSLARELRDDLDAGILAGWGACITIFFGGILNATATCSIPTVAAIVGIGAAIAIIDFLRRPTLQFRIGYAPLVLLALLTYSASICWRSTWNANDDFLAYLIYPIKMLQTGAALDPFSLRRLSTLGGYSFLESTLLLVARPQNIFLLDIGLGGILACIQVIPLLRRAGASAFFAALASSICLTIPLGRINSMVSTFSLAAFLTLFRSIDLLAKSTGPTRARIGCIVGMVAAAVTTLRPNFLPVVGLTILLTAFLWPIARKQAIADFSRMLAAALIGIIPWSIAHHAATASWFYPLFPGNQRNDIEILSAHMHLLALVRFTIGFFLRPKMLLLILLGGIGLSSLRSHATAFWFATLLSTALVVSKFTSSDYPNLTRYCLPPLAAATIVIWIEMQNSTNPLRRRIGQWLLGSFAFVLIIYSCIAHSGPVYQSLASINESLVRRTPLYSPTLAALYAEAQSSIPPGRRILTIADYPFLLDYRRNPIESIDWPGIASPRPGIPFFQGPAALAQYFQDQSIDAILVIDFDNNPTNLYHRDQYNDPNWPDAMVRRAASHELDLMQNIDALARAAPLLFNKDNLRVIQLSKQGPP